MPQVYKTVKLEVKPGIHPTLRSMELSHYYEKKINVNCSNHSLSLTPQISVISVRQPKSTMVTCS